MKISQAGLDLISRFEGLRLTAYRDPVGILTIGFGHTGADVRPGMKITRKRAFELLRKDTTGAAREVQRLVKRPLKQCQFDALCSLVFNAGSAPLHGTLGRRLNDGDITGAHAEFAKWVKGRFHGRLVTFEGLVRRRAAEAAMFAGSSNVHDPTAVLTTEERRWVRRFDKLVAERKGRSPEAEGLFVKMKRQRKTIWRLAQPAENGGDGNGWHFRHRIERYRALLARTS